MFLTKHDKFFSILHTAEFHKTFWHPEKNSTITSLIHELLQLSSWLWHDHTSSFPGFDLQVIPQNASLKYYITNI